MIRAQDIRIVAIGASTGGPTAIQVILSGLPHGFPAPVLIVQHMASGFVEGFADWLSQSTGFPVRAASHGERPLPGHAYIAPDGYNMGISSDCRVELKKGGPGDKPCPSVSHLFSSVADALNGHAVGVLLTGMGKDGAAELKLMKQKGAVTIVQDRESAAVYGMPGEAVSIHAATHVLRLGIIAATLTGLVNKERAGHVSG